MGIGALVVRSPAFRRSTRTAPSSIRPSSFLNGHSFLSRRCPRRSGIFMPWEHLSADRIFAELSALPVPALLIRSSGVPAFQCSAVLRRSVFAAPAVTRPAAHRSVFGSPALYRSPHWRQLTTATSLRVHRVAHGSSVFGALAPLSAHGLSAFTVSPSAYGHLPFTVSALRPRRCSLLLAARCRPYFPASQRTTACTSRFVRKPPCAALPILRPRKGIEPTRR